MAAVPATLFELSWYLRGMSQVLSDLAANKDFMHAHLDRLMEWIMTAGNKLVQLGVDVIWMGDDFGAQERMMISPQTFREFFKRTAGRGGGLILSPAHNMQPQVPLENIPALYESAKHYGHYPIRDT